jgi:hypothetical protein
MVYHWIGGQTERDIDMEVVCGDFWSG